MGSNGNQPLPVERFGGIDLAADPTEVGWDGAVDALNTMVDQRGRVRTRPGYLKTNGSAVTDNVVTLHRRLSGITEQWIGSDDGNNLVAYGSDLGGVIATTAVASLNERNVVYVDVGTPTATYTYVGLGSTSGGATATRRWDGAAWSSPAGVPVASALGVTPWDNRLVAANYNGTNPHRVSFSDAGAPETFGANNYVDLTPGDGEFVAAIRAWRDLLFVFKQTKYFVFYGTSTSSTGTPVFNYRTVEAGVGVEIPYSAGAQVFQTVNPVARGRDALYFANQFGVYATTGGLPLYLSAAIEPAYRYSTSFVLPPNTYTGPTLAPGASPSLAYVRGAPGDLLYINAGHAAGATSGGSTGGFVLNIDTSTWMPHDIPFLAMFDQGGVPVFVKCDKYAYRVVENATTDGGSTVSNGAAITSRYRSGFKTPGGAGVEVSIRSTELTGQGTVQFGWARDFTTTIGLTSNVTLGTAPAAVRGYHLKAVRGENLSWQVASVSGGVWQLNRVVPFLRDARGPGGKTS